MSWGTQSVGNIATRPDPLAGWPGTAQYQEEKPLLQQKDLVCRVPAKSRCCVPFGCGSWPKPCLASMPMVWLFGASSLQRNGARDGSATYPNCTHNAAACCLCGRREREGAALTTARLSSWSDLLLGASTRPLQLGCPFAHLISQMSLRPLRSARLCISIPCFQCPASVPQELPRRVVPHCRSLDLSRIHNVQLGEQYSVLRTP